MIPYQSDSKYMQSKVPGNPALCSTFACKVCGHMGIWTRFDGSVRLAVRPSVRLGTNKWRFNKHSVNQMNMRFKLN